MIVNRDIDGLVSALMLSEVTGWKIGAITWAKKILVHPDFADVNDLLSAKPYAVDLYSSQLPSLSNHMQFVGADSLSANANLKDLVRDYDNEVAKRGAHLDTFAFVPSIWAGSQAANPDDTDPKSRRYRYPMGSAQLLLALLESIGEAPTIRDLQYTPTLIAHCDGALETAVTAGYNVLPWIDMLTAAAGIQSWTAHNRSALLSNGPDAYNGLVRSLHAESPDIARDLTLEWNLSGVGDRRVHRNVVEWLMRENGWADPFMPGTGGSDGLSFYYTFRARTNWRVFDLIGDYLAVDDSSLISRGAQGVADDLAAALASVNTGAYQRGETTLFWNTTT